MVLTSAQANKLLATLKDKLDSLMGKESLSCEFNCAVGENPEVLRPSYDFKQTQDEINLLNQKIRVLKHAINLFNVTTVVDGYDMTVDQMLIYIPVLSNMKKKYNKMKNKLERARVESYGHSNIIDYTIINYDTKEAEDAFVKVSDELNRAQLALDAVNSSKTFEVDLDL